MSGKLSLWIRSAPLLLLGLPGLLLAIPPTLLRPASAEPARQEAAVGNGEERPARRRPPGVTVWLWQDSGSLVLQSTNATNDDNWALSGTITTSEGVRPITIVIGKGVAAPVSWEGDFGFLEDEDVFWLHIPGDRPLLLAERNKPGKTVVLVLEAIGIPVEQLANLASAMLDDAVEACRLWASQDCGGKGNVCDLWVDEWGCYWTCCLVPTR